MRKALCTQLDAGNLKKLTLFLCIKGSLLQARRQKKTLQKGIGKDFMLGKTTNIVLERLSFRLEAFRHLASMLYPNSWHHNVEMNALLPSKIK